MEEVLAPEVALVETGRRTTLRLRGMVGIMCAAELLSAARRAASRRGAIVVDLASVEHVDCAGAQVLLALRRAAAEQGRSFEVRGVGGPRGYLQLAGLDKALGLA